jgi:nucleotide-binding universal stress UspA family protein
MYARVLVPLDGSEVAEAVLPFAERVAGPVDAELVLLRVVEPVTAAEAMAAAGVGSADALFLRELEAKRYLAEVEQRLGARGLRVRSEVRVGSPAAEIAAAAAECGAELVAMTTHGRGGLGRLIWGSVAEAVLRHAALPVLMVRMTPAAAAPAAAHARTGAGTAPAAPSEE